MTRGVVPGIALSRSSVLPLPPSLNNVFVNVPGKGRFKARVYKQWRSAAHWDLISQHPAPRLVASPYRVTISVPTNARADLDNLIKPLLDVLVDAGVMTDDRDVLEIVARKNCATPGRCVVLVESL